MALIECPGCNKRISSKAKTCQYCGDNLTGDTESLSHINHIKRSSQLMNQSLLAMTMFIAGVVIWFWRGEPAEGLRATIAGGFFVLGFAGYLFTRIQLVMHKRKKV